MTSRSSSLPGLRDRKAAQTRVAITRALDARLVDAPLAGISVDDLARDAGISRMTFFNHFPSKESAVDYSMVVWLTQLEAGLGALRGVRAIQEIFARMGDEMAHSTARMRRIFAHFTAREGARTLPVLGIAERLLIAPELTHDLPNVGLGPMLLRALSEAREDGELSFEGSDYELAHYLGALATGSAIIGHSATDTDWRQLFRRHVHRALGLFSVKGMKAPKAPLVPARYRNTSPKKPTPLKKPATKSRSKGRS